MSIVANGTKAYMASKDGKMNGKGMPSKQQIPPELQRFVNARGIPAVFMFLRGSMQGEHAILTKQLVANRRFSELDIVINSGGGAINPAYKIVQILRQHCDQLYACVPFFAKSAATLVCVGADKIILDELSELGPLDTQILEEGRGGKAKYVSALNLFKALEQLQTLSIETLDIAMKLMTSSSYMDMDECLGHAIQYVGVTTGPLITQLNPEKLGEYSRALSVGEDYGKRLLHRYKGWTMEKCDEVMGKLVYSYPSHDYIIDMQELLDLGFDAEFFKDDVSEVLPGLYKHLAKSENLLLLVEPSSEESEGTPTEPFSDFSELDDALDDELFDEETSELGEEGGGSAEEDAR